MTHFTGKERDAETGLDNFGKRYDASSLGRFMTPDPIFMTKHRLIDPQQWNLYAYVRNNPVNLTDPTGLDFNLSCDKNNGTTCQGGHQYYKDSNGKYQETVVKSDKNGNLTDQSKNKYTRNRGPQETGDRRDVHRFSLFRAGKKRGTSRLSPVSPGGTPQTIPMPMPSPRSLEARTFPTRPRMAPPTLC